MFQTFKISYRLSIKEFLFRIKGTFTTQFRRQKPNTETLTEMADLNQINYSSFEMIKFSPEKIYYNP